MNKRKLFFHGEVKLFQDKATAKLSTFSLTVIQPIAVGVFKGNFLSSFKEWK